MDFNKNDEKDECLLENCQIIQVHGKQQGRRLDKPGKSVSEESRPEGVHIHIQRTTIQRCLGRLLSTRGVSGRIRVLGTPGGLSCIKTQTLADGSS